MLDILKSQLGSSFRSVGHFLKRPIGVGERGVVTLGVPAEELRARARAEQRMRVRRMRRDLYVLMQQHTGSRELMRHLDLVERTLRQQGLAAVEALPVRVVATALTQLERLVWDWTPAGLAELRSRMAIRVKEHRAKAPQESLSTTPEFDVSVPCAADVTEVDHALFEEMERSWAGQLPDGAAAAISQAKANA
jgi:hypothetical protein